MSKSFSSRREFLQFFGRSAATIGASSFVGSTSFGKSVPEIVNHEIKRHLKRVPKLPFTPLQAMSVDTVMTPKGFEWSRLITWGDRINAKGEMFGFNNDYIAIFPQNTEGTDLVMWVNHESVEPLFTSGFTGEGARTRVQVEKEQLEVGGSLVRIRKNADGKWKFVEDDAFNRRLDATTEIPLIAPRQIRGSKTAVGTFANCAGGVTPWKTLLTCEENYQDFYGEAVYEGKMKSRRVKPSALGWEKIFSRPPEHYGWVVEVNPLTGEAKKLTALGRFAHECATTTVAPDGRCVVYSGDDGDNRSLYKFISDKPGSLETGSLYAADLENKKWIPLNIKTDERLRAQFSDQLDVLIHCRTAVEVVGASKLDRPEDIEIDKATGAVYVCLTNNNTEKRPFGSILKIMENGNNPLSMNFEHATFAAGGEESGFACPDNLVFDRKGNLWMTVDVSGSKMNKAPFEKFGNNSLFYIPLSGPEAGKAHRVASAPHDAEFTGPCFSPDGRTLFLSVQHPGEQSKSLDQLTSSWPGGGSSLPRSAVIALSGPAMDALVL